MWRVFANVLMFLYTISCEFSPTFVTSNSTNLVNVIFTFNFLQFWFLSWLHLFFTFILIVCIYTWFYLLFFPDILLFIDINFFFFWKLIQFNVIFILHYLFFLFCNMFFFLWSIFNPESNIFTFCLMFL